mgnify:CR=1 FL=1
MNKIKIAVLGLGVVGSHVVKLLEKNSYILDDTKCEIVAIGAKNKKTVSYTHLTLPTIGEV